MHGNPRNDSRIGRWFEILAAVVGVLTVVFIVSSSVNDRIDRAQSQVSSNMSRVTAAESRLNALDLTDKRIIDDMAWYHRRLMVATDERGDR